MNDLVTINEAILRFVVSPNTIRAHISAGELTVKERPAIGNRHPAQLVRISELERLGLPLRSARNEAGHDCVENRVARIEAAVTQLRAESAAISDAVAAIAESLAPRNDEAGAAPSRWSWKNVQQVLRSLATRARR